MSFVFSLPTFNLNVNVWRTGADPTTDPPDVTCLGNLAWGKRVNVSSTGGTGDIGVPLVTMTLLVPALTDVRDDPTTNFADIVEVPAGSGRFYYAVYVDDLGKGFDNEHRGVVLLAKRPRTYPLT